MQKISKFIIHYSIFLIILIMSFGILGIAVDVRADDPLGVCAFFDGSFKTTTKMDCNKNEGSSSWGQFPLPTTVNDPNAITLTPAGNSGTNNATSSPSSTTTSTPLTDGLVPCDKGCGFNEFMALINRVIKFILFDMVIPIAAIMFAYAGFLFLTAGGDTSSARTKAKDIFFNAVLGLIIAVAAFLIIRTILSILGYEGSWIGFNPLSGGI